MPSSSPLTLEIKLAGKTWTQSVTPQPNMAVTIGQPLYKVRLIFWDNAIQSDLPVSSLKVTRGGTALGAAVLTSDMTLHQVQDGGYLDVWMTPGADTTFEVTVSALNSGRVMQKTGQTIPAGSS